MRHDHKSCAKLQWCSSKKWVAHWQTTSNNYHNSSPRNPPNFSVAEIPIANALQVSQSALEPRYLLQGAKRLMVTCSRIYVRDHLVHIRDKTVNMFVSWQTYLFWVGSNTRQTIWMDGLVQRTERECGNFDPMPQYFFIRPLIWRSKNVFPSRKMDI